MADVFPDVIRIETVGICNFSCIHCPTGTEPNKRTVLKPAKFNEILDSFKAHDFVPRVVVLYHGGEPLLNKWLPDYIKTLKDYGVTKTVITTNTSLLTEENSRRLVLAGLDEMKVSYDGSSPEENDEIRVSADFKRDSENLLTLLRAKRELGRTNPKVIVSNVRFIDRNTPSGDLGENNTLETPQYLLDTFAEFTDELVINSFPAMVWPGLNKLGDLEEIDGEQRSIDYCSSLFETTTILSNGNVVACCYDLPGETVFGNVNFQSLFDIWEGPKYTEFRDAFRKQDYPDLCKKCSVVCPRLLVRKEPQAA